MCNCTGCSAFHLGACGHTSSSTIRKCSTALEQHLPQRLSQLGHCRLSSRSSARSVQLWGIRAAQVSSLPFSVTSLQRQDPSVTLALAESHYSSSAATRNTTAPHSAELVGLQHINCHVNCSACQMFRHFCATCRSPWSSLSWSSIPKHRSLDSRQLESLAEVGQQLPL